MVAGEDGVAGVHPDSPTSIEVVRVEPRHAGLLADFIRTTWDPKATEERVLHSRARAATENPAAAGEEAPTFLFLSEGRAIGHVTTIPIRLWLDGETFPAHWIKGLMVAPEHRNGPVGFMLLKEAMRHLNVALAMVVQEAPRRLFQALGFTDLGLLSNHLRVLRPARLVRAIDPAAVGLASVPAWATGALRLAQRPAPATFTGWVIGGVTGVWTRIVGGGGRSLVTNTPETLDPPAVDDLWNRVAPRLRASLVRDGAYLHWRYESSEPGLYWPATAADRSGLIGLAIVRRPGQNGDPRLRGIRVATLSELIFPHDRPEVGLALMRTADELARRLESDAILCSASHPVAEASLRRRAFLPIPGNVHVLARGLPSKGAEAPVLGDWWFTRGDSNADESF